MSYSDITLEERHRNYMIDYMNELDITLKMTWWERIYYFFDCKNKYKMSHLIETQKFILQELYEELTHVEYSYDILKKKLDDIKSHIE